MGQLKKDHRKKVAARNANIKNNQKRLQKAQQEWLMDLINREKAAGKFDNVPPAITDQEQILGAQEPTFTEIKGPII